MKKIISKIWAKWLLIVKEHNERLSECGVCWERHWMKADGFLPIFVGIFMGFLFYMFGMLITLIYEFDVIFYSSFFCLIVICFEYLKMYLEWKKYLKICIAKTIN